MEITKFGGAEVQRCPGALELNEVKSWIWKEFFHF